MALVCFYGTLRINDGPLKGKRYSRGDEGFWYVDEAKRVAYAYFATSPPHKKLRKRSAYYVRFAFNVKSRRSMRMAKQQQPQWPRREGEK